MTCLSNAGKSRAVAMAAVLMLVLPASLALGQRGDRRSTPAVHQAQSRNEGNRGFQNRSMGNRQYENRNYGAQGNRQLAPQGYPGRRGYPAAIRPQGPPGYPGRPQAYPGAGQRQPYRPAYPGGAYWNTARGAVARQPYNYPGANRPGHLPQWMNQHGGTNLQQQERMLHNDPSFRRLPGGDQQRLMQQLRQVDRMPQGERERRLARNEMIERLSPEQRMQVNRSMRQFQGLPPQRRTMVGQAFRQLQSVPQEQRETVINSARYQNMFSPQERGMLSNLLRVEPYEPSQ